MRAKTQARMIKAICHPKRPDENSEMKEESWLELMKKTGLNDEELSTIDGKKMTGGPFFPVPFPLPPLFLPLPLPFPFPFPFPFPLPLFRVYFVSVEIEIPAPLV